MHKYLIGILTFSLSFMVFAQNDSLTILNKKNNEQRIKLSCADLACDFVKVEKSFKFYKDDDIQYFVIRMSDFYQQAINKPLRVKKNDDHYRPYGFLKSNLRKAKLARLKKLHLDYYTRLALSPFSFLIDTILLPVGIEESMTVYHRPGIEDYHLLNKVYTKFESEIGEFKINDFKFKNLIRIFLKLKGSEKFV